MPKYNGLTSAEAQDRLIRFGPNELIENKSIGFLQDLGQILLDPGGLMLLILGILYWILGNKNDAFILFAAYLPITAVDVALNIHSGKVLKTLQETLAPKAKVYRDGMILEIATRFIVPDDILVFEEGITIPADGILIEATNLRINEAALTGESVPVEKTTGSGFLAGTIPYTGNGIGKILVTGSRTEFGKIGKLIQTTKDSKSPLRKKMDRIVRIIFAFAILVSSLLFFLEWNHQRKFIASLIPALTFGMSTIPEEFPIVFTLYLSLGAWRLSKKNVLVKSLPSVETLGGVDVICTDKTGTLTEGRFDLDEFKIWNPNLDPTIAWKTALMACEVHTVDPMEIPISERCQSLSITLEDWNLIEDIPFDPTTKMMAHRWKHQQTGEKVLAMKGAIESILNQCSLNENERVQIIHENEEITKAGKRVLAVASFESSQNDPIHKIRMAKWIGLLVYHDPIRATATSAVEECTRAGIEIKMITGDHLMTAHAVADRIGISHLPRQMHTADTILKMNTEDRTRAYLDGVIFARFTPELKHELVKALKDSGKIVAMTGDGINDAPALRLADIGISMGKKATDAARSSAKMVLIENDFSGVVDAVFEGRRIFNNLVKSFSYLISFHTPVVILALVPPLLGWPPVMIPTHIILLELIVHPVSAFTFENLKSDQSERNTKLINQKRAISAIFSGVLISAAALLVFRWFPSISVEQSRALSFAIVCFGNAYFVFSECRPRFHRRFVITTLLILFFTFAATGIPAIANRLHLDPIGWRTQLMMLIISGVAIFRMPNFRPT